MNIETIKRLHNVLDDITLGNNKRAFDELGKIINEQYLTLTDVSQQRELLDGLLFHLEKESYIEGSFLSRDEIIKEYLQTI